MTDEKPFLVRFARTPFQRKLEGPKVDTDHFQSGCRPTVVPPRPTIQTAVTAETSDDR